MQALGTAVGAFFAGLVAQLATADGGEPNEQKLNFMLAVIKGIKPRDQLEAMLAAQMAAVHSAAMKAARDLADAESLQHRDSAERTFNKLTRTFVTQMEALKRYRMGGEQTVTVQQVNVSEGGQAIVGNVTQGQQDAVSNHIPPQPLAISHDPTFQCPSLETTSVFRFQPHEMRNENDARSFTQYGSDLSSPRCGAKTRTGKPCRSPAVQGRSRCRMHGGAADWGSARQQECAEAWALYSRCHCRTPTARRADAGDRAN